jgi:2-dehydro-3-deoxygluconokinase
MLEISAPEMGASRSTQGNLSFGGDTLNTAVYLSRLGAEVDYITALGNDSMSDWMLDQWRAEGIGCDRVKRHSGKPPGLYLIQVDQTGERSFIYWRDGSPAHLMFSDTGTIREALSDLKDYGTVYLSGITLALFTEQSRQLLFEILQDFRKQGGRVAFDGNYRPAQWPDRPAARLQLTR